MQSISPDKMPVCQRHLTQSIVISCTKQQVLPALQVSLKGNVKKVIYYFKTFNLIIL